MRIHPKFVMRQITRSRSQAAVFVACVSLSIVSLIALNGLSRSVNLMLQAGALDVAYEAVLLDEDLKAGFRKAGIRDPVAALLLVCQDGRDE